MNKVRRVVVLSGDSFGVLALKLVAPVTTFTAAKAGKMWLVPVNPSAANGLETESVVDALQVRGLSTKRFKRRVGRLSDEDMVEVTTAVALVIEYE